MGSTMMELIPGLPHDLGVECLLRVPFSKIPSLKLVCKDWKALMEQPEFYRARKSANKAQSILILSQSQVTDYEACNYDPPYHLVALEPETGCWWVLPLIPEFEAGLPRGCEKVASGSYLVVMGGRDRQSQEYLHSVLVFDFLSYKWRRGANMPGGQTCFFGYAFDDDGTIYVAGGLDAKKISQKSAWAYHVSADTWAQLPDMPHSQGVIDSFTADWHESVEIFDVSSRQWLILDSGDDDDKIIKYQKHCITGVDQKLYARSSNDLVVSEDGKWKVVARLPYGVATDACITPFPGHLLLNSMPQHDYPNDTYILDLKDVRWTRLDAPTKYSGHVVSGCCVTI